MPAARRTGLVYDERCLLHRNGSMIDAPEAVEWLEVPHVERPERLRRSLQVLERSGVAQQLVRIEARDASEEELALAHSPEHVTAMHEACHLGRLVDVGPSARAGPGSWEAALRSAGGLLAALEAVASGRVENAFGLLRPPGHHATATQAMGYCLFNAVAVAARAAQRDHGLARIAVVDWDVHHGNGTQAIFEPDSSVLFVSLHQRDFYPAGSGRLDEQGTGDGEGFTVNVPLPAGSGDEGYAHAFERIVEPSLRAFGPDLLIVSAGQDPSAGDPLGRMSVTAEGFRDMARRAVALAQECCDGRLLVFQEGGYSIDHVPFCNLAIVEALAGLEPAVVGEAMGADVPAGLQDSERAAVAAAAEAYARFWPLA